MYAELWKALIEYSRKAINCKSMRNVYNSQEKLPQFDMIFINNKRTAVLTKL